MRFVAPPHTNGISLSIGYFPVEDGHIEVPDDTPQGDLGGLSVNGFTPAPIPDATPAPTAPTAPTKAPPAQARDTSID